MARKFAQVSVMLWGRDSFRSLTAEAQRLYLLLSTSPTTNLAGIADWRPKRLVLLSSNTTEENLSDAMSELELSGIVVVDHETEEAWLRPMIEDDGLLRGPKTTAGILASWAVIGSQMLREAIADHIRGIVDDAPVVVQAMLEPIVSYGYLPEPPKPKIVPVPPERTKPPSATRFDEFWAAYPRKSGKAGALRKYETIVKQGTPEQAIIDGAIKYGVARHGQDDKYTKLPLTWLNQGCWDDEMEEPHFDPYSPENGW